MRHEVSTRGGRVEALGPRHRGARVPPALRAAIAAYAREERAGGASCGAIAERLGVCSESIRRWARTGPGRDGRAGGLVPGHVVGEAGRALTVWSPSGYRGGGPSVPGAAAPLRRRARAAG